MESRDGDDWVDKFMLLIANSAKPIAEEWFKLSQWFIVLAVFSFLSTVTEHVAFDLALGVSFVILWAYFLFYYQKLWHYRFNKFVESNNLGTLSHIFVYAIGSVVTLLIASGMLSLAKLFGSEAAIYLHSSVQ